MGITAFLPRTVRDAIRSWRGYGALTTARGWEKYARDARTRGDRVGEEWSVAEEIGLDPSVTDVAAYIDSHVIAPFVGRSGVLLEIGSGGGRWTARLLERCDRLIACDTAPTMIALLRERLQGRGGHVEYVLLDGTGLPTIADGSVDFVFSYDVFVHLPQWDIFNYLLEIRRVLRPGGRAMIHHGHVFSTLGWRNFIDELPQSVNQHKPFGNFSVMTPEIMRGFIERAGLHCDAIRTDLVPRDAIAMIVSPPSQP